MQHQRVGGCSLAHIIFVENDNTEYFEGFYDLKSPRVEI